MADILASALVTTLVRNLNSSALQEIGLARGLKDGLKSLEKLANEAQDAAYDAQDILDEFTIESSRRRRGTRHQLNSYFSRRNPVLFRLKIGRELRIVRERLDAIAEERIKFHLAEGVTDHRVGGIVESRETTSLVNEQEIVGRTEDKEKIIETLLGTTRDDELSVYAIRGMGGLGKTTLAQLVYNDERTNTHFDLRIWVCVSDDFSIRRILGAIIESIDQRGCNISALDALQRYLQEKLRGKRFLLVLDDVWNENDSLWDELKEALRCGSQGSVLMVTTRIEKIAGMMATIPIHHLVYLSEADSWSLFRQRAFARGEGDECLMEIGEAIVRKAGGVPLAIKALGSLMRTKSSEREWLAIRESEIWHLPEGENGILPALRLSYDNLRPHMRQCFAYCCIFPKDYKMDKDWLVELWMANGFLPPEGQTDLHLTGHSIFKELVWRSFFQDVNAKTCTMHDLVHDLAQSVMKHETYIVGHSKALKIPGMLRHMSFYVKGKVPLIASNSLHSLIAPNHERPFEKKDISPFISKQQHLRVLHLPFSLKKLPNLICKLEHLRYLTLSCFNCERLPESLSCLHYLQTLKLSESYHLQELPEGLKHMKNLWFLDLESHYSFRRMPAGVGDLTWLQRLSIFIVGKESGTQIDQLKELKLGGELSIRGLENLRNFEDAKSANLMRKKNLTSLSLSWMNGPMENYTKNFEEVLEGLQPYQNLEKLFIRCYQASRFPDWMSTSACKNLTEISLNDCHKCERLPPLGKLSSLTHLNLYKLDSVKHLDDEWHGNGETSFPALMDLTIDGMPNLEEWTIPDSGDSFPHLKCLEISSCPKLNGLPALPALRDLVLASSNVALLRSIVSLTSLSSICLSNFVDLDVVPQGLLQDHEVLKKLEISWLPKIRSLSNVLDNLSNLKTLSLKYCSNLEFVHEGLKHLHYLEYLYIGNCDNLTSFPATMLQDLSSLRRLEFEDCKRLNPLLGPLQRESALKDLVISGCPEFKYLPESLQQFTRLRYLGMLWCEELHSLPDWLGHLQSLSRIDIVGSRHLNALPDCLRSLKSLRHIDIARCDPQLEKRCKKAEGEDWPKISHISCIHINWQYIQ